MITVTVSGPFGHVREYSLNEFSIVFNRDGKILSCSLEVYLEHLDDVLTDLMERIKKLEGAKDDGRAVL